MSEAPTAILAYGYDLGGHDSGWNFTYKPNSQLRQVIEENKFAGEAIEDFLLRAYGFTEDPQVHTQGYWARRANKLQEIGVKVVRYGSPSYPGYILANYLFEVDEYGSRELKIPTVELGARARVMNAYFKLDIVAKYNPNPTWILAAFYG